MSEIKEKQFVAFKTGVLNNAPSGVGVWFDSRAEGRKFVKDKNDKRRAPFSYKWRLFPMKRGPRA